MNRRLIALVAALLLAGGGTFVLVNFVRGAEERATAGEELTTVWVVQTTIPKGTSGASIGSYVAQDEVLAKSVPPGAYTQDLQAMQTALTGFAAAVDILPGEVVINSRWVAEELLDNARPDVPTRREPPNPRMLQVPIRFTAEQALGGIILPGETVAIIASFDDYTVENGSIDLEGSGDVVVLPEAAGDGGGGAEASQSATRILIHKAFVTEVQAESVPQFEVLDEELESGATLAPATGFVVTFALYPEDVERLIFAKTYGSLWLASQAEEAYDYPTNIVLLDEIFDDTVPIGLEQELAAGPVVTVDEDEDDEADTAPAGDDDAAAGDDTTGEG